LLLYYPGVLQGETYGVGWREVRCPLQRVAPSLRGSSNGPFDAGSRLLTTAADQPEDGARDGCYQEEAGSGACGGHDHLLKVN